MAQLMTGLSLRSIELCAGAGGLALGVARAGFHHVAVVDSDIASCETLKSNKDRAVAHVKDWQIVASDVRDLSFSTYGNLDLLSGGPPCQPFSIGGRRHGRRDPRNMFPDFIRAIRTIRPKAFLLENVRGLVGPSSLPYFSYIIQQLQFPDITRAPREKWTEHRARLEELYTANCTSELRYQVIWQPLNAADYGVAQRRERVFIVGIRSDLCISYSFPPPTHSRTALLYHQWVSGEYWDRHEIPKKKRPERPPSFPQARVQVEAHSATKPWKTVRDEISALPNVGLGRTSRKIANHFFNPGARSYQGHDGSSLDAPAKTIKAGQNGVPGGENMVRMDNGEVRYFTVRECARLQAFPDDWVFEGSWCASMRQVGNAVPVTLGEAVARPLAAALTAPLPSSK
jgi:DNA (cytosine-5)-methyltransferase 1